MACDIVVPQAKAGRCGGEVEAFFALSQVSFGPPAAVDLHQQHAHDDNQTGKGRDRLEHRAAVTFPTASPA